ncbi:MAG TPA: ethanolamine ammonia-lyase subunit EutC [Pinirhizobacter sp.]|uniref:ethanolamine ammonia-lyase subunit EutC n=1 Tax=Pinirhizobacter sp. TaxID=2950432 RepID=UPI002C4AA032|nr:ethanolamine ammonia-lyase subunit EutC [Pinirhizobacter sp.]HMH66426.1 ethanolamine ammonia-lyase subunit EutC [Pinirhizobacter sp.]
MTDRTIPKPWQQLRELTPARIGTGRVGTSVSTADSLAFGVDHARARDAVHLPFDAQRLADVLAERGQHALIVRSAAADRREYLLRPDLGRQLDDAGRQYLESKARSCDVVFVIADGLSALATEHALPLLDVLRPRLAGLAIGPTVIATQARVALGDEVGYLLQAKLVVVLIGERPGLSSPDSMAAYLTYAPRVGRTDAERNCVSNIRPAGLGYASAAATLGYLITQSLSRGVSGIALKDDSDSPPGLPGA